MAETKDEGMTHAEVIALNTKLGKVKGLKGAELNFAVKKNLKKLKPDIEAYAEQENEVKDIAKEFSDAKKKLQEEYSTVDGKVKTRVNNSGPSPVIEYDVPKEKEKELEDKIAALKEQHKDKIKEADDKWKELMDSRMKEKSDFQPYTIKRHHIPADISTEDMDLIFDLIRDND